MTSDWRCVNNAFDFGHDEDKEHSQPLISLDRDL